LTARDADRRFESTPAPGSKYLPVPFDEFRLCKSKDRMGAAVQKSELDAFDFGAVMQTP